MLRKVLVVDDDRILLNVIKKQFKKHEDYFDLLLASDGLEAVEVLKEHSISLVVTDIQMPNMDGFALIAHLSDIYPDIPVIILTGYPAPGWKKAVLIKKALQYLEKPFVVDELIETIKGSLEKELDGGILHSISLEMFVQLVEMDVRTCTIRVLNKQADKKGVLFFKDGELMDARIGERHGMPVAMEILSWNKPTMFIQDSCIVEENKIKRDLQAILMEAMRLKDEAEDEDAGD